MRFADKAHYFQVVTAFFQLLNESEGLPTSEGNAGPEYSFAVFSDKGKKKKDIELLLSLHERDLPELKNRTLVYWQVEGDISTAHDEVLKLLNGKDLIPIQTDKHNRFYATARSVVGDDSGNLVGLIINPPYPRHGSLRTKRRGLFRYLIPLASLLVGIALGPALLGKNRR